MRPAVLRSNRDPAADVPHDVSGPALAMKYLDFELSVDSRGQNEYEVSVRSPNGQARSRIPFPFEPAQLETYRSALGRAIELSRGEPGEVARSGGAGRAQQMASVEAFGQALFASLLSGKILVAYRASAAMAEQGGVGLRLQLRLQAPEMAALPWEFMFDSDENSFVCLDPDKPLVRYPELDRAARALTARWPLRILGMVASPLDLPQLDKDEERHRIEHSLESLREDGLVQLDWVDGGTYRDLQDAMRRGPWHVFHFIGHGGFTGSAAGGSGFLALESTPTMESATPETGDLSAGLPGCTHRVPAEVVGQLLRGHRSLRLVLLNSCSGARSSTTDIFSSTAATLVRRGIPAVVAMQYPISDQAALAFAHAFYSSLAARAPVDRAVVDARTAIQARRTDSIEWATPVLLMRSPTGDLFPQVGAGWLGRVRAAVSSVWTPRRVLVALVGAAVPGIAAAVLASTPVSRLDIGLDAKVERIRLTLPAPQPLAEPIALSSLGATNLSAAAFPASVRAGGQVEVERALLMALDENGRRGRITLDLTTIMPAGTRLTLATSGVAGEYDLSLGDSIADFAVGVVGPVRITAGQLNRRVDFTAPEIVRLYPDRGALGLQFRPADTTQTRFMDQVHTSELNLIRVDRYESSQTMTLDVSMIESGVLLFVDLGTRRELEPRELIRIAKLEGGVARLELGGDHVGVLASGSVEGLISGSGSERRDLRPSRLDWMLARHGRLVAALAALYLTVLALVLIRPERRPE